MASLLFDWLTRDGKLLLAAKIVRAFAYGFLSVILAIYLKLIGFDELLIGLIFTTTLLNSVIFTLIASFYADKIGRRKFLLIYAVYFWSHFCYFTKLYCTDYSCIHWDN
ncbi:hypothetical protein BH18THE2_BH18THE2_28610 [soil metagenome]